MCTKYRQLTCNQGYLLLDIRHFCWFPKVPSLYILFQLAAHGCMGSGWGLQFLLQIVVRFIHSYCKIFISTFNTDRRGTVGVGTIQFAINIFYFLYSINHRLLMGVFFLPLFVFRHCKTVLKTFIPFLYLQTSFTVSTAAYFDVNKLLHVVCRSLIWLFRSSYFSDLSIFHLLLYTK